MQLDQPLDLAQLLELLPEARRQQLPTLYAILTDLGKRNLLKLVLINLIPVKLESVCAPILNYLDQTELPAEITDWYGIQHGSGFGSFFSYSKPPTDPHNVYVSLAHMVAARFPVQFFWELDQLVLDALKAYFEPIFSKSLASPALCAQVLTGMYNAREPLTEETLLKTLDRHRLPITPNEYQANLVAKLDNYPLGDYNNLQPLYSILRQNLAILPDIYSAVDQGKAVMIYIMFWAVSPVHGIDFFDLCAVSKFKLPATLTDWSVLNKRLDLTQRFSYDQIPLNPRQLAQTLAHEFLLSLPTSIVSDDLINPMADVIQAYWNNYADLSLPKATKRLVDLYVYHRFDPHHLKRALPPKHRSRSSSPKRN